MFCQLPAMSAFPVLCCEQGHGAQDAVCFKGTCRGSYFLTKALGAETQKQPEIAVPAMTVAHETKHAGESVSLCMEYEQPEITKDEELRLQASSKAAIQTSKLALIWRLFA